MPNTEDACTGLGTPLPILMQNLVGSSNVGKRTLLSRLLSVDFDDVSESSSEVLVHGWTIDTKRSLYGWLIFMMNSQLGHCRCSTAWLPWSWFLT
ncbi:hypothetical protein SLA2020_397240 [Shorea laevis]